MVNQKSMIGYVTLLLLIAVISFSGCSKKIEKISRKINSNTASIQFETLELSISQGTVTNSEVIIRRANKSDVPKIPRPQENLIGEIFEIKFKGDLPQKPVTISMSYDKNMIPSNAEEDYLKIGYFDGENWYTLPSTIDKSKGKVYTVVSHFSFFQLIIDGMIGQISPAINYFKDYLKAPNMGLVTFNELPSLIKDNLLETYGNSERIFNIISIEVPVEQKIHLGVIHFWKYLHFYLDFLSVAISANSEKVAEALIEAVKIPGFPIIEQYLGENESTSKLYINIAKGGANLAQYKLFGATPVTATLTVCNYIAGIELDLLEDKNFISQGFRWDKLEWWNDKPLKVYIVNVNMAKNVKENQSETGMLFWYFNENTQNWENYYNDLITAKISAKIDLELTSSPSGAKVNFQGGDLDIQGKTPIIIKDVELGLPYLCELNLNGYEKYSDHLFIENNKLHIDLKEKTYYEPQYRNLRITSNPQGAEVIFDGIFKGRTPLTLDRISKNSHSLIVSMEGYEQHTKRGIFQEYYHINLNRKPRPVEKKLPEAGLVAYYPFNGNAKDESDNGYDGTFIGVSLSSDRHGNTNYAANFNGRGDYIELPKSRGLINQIQSLSFWIYFYTENFDDGKNVNEDYILAKAHDTGYQRDTFARGSTNKIGNWFGTSSNSKSFLQTKTVFRRDKWYHITFVRDYNTNRVYVNGVLDASINYSGYFIDDNDPLKIGIYHDNYGIVRRLNRWLNGKIDDLRIYNRSLTKDEVKMLYNEGK